MSGFIDLHCHLLPGIDDGPIDDRATVELARALVADGVRTVAATPHHTVRLRSRSGEIAERTAAVRRLFAAEGIELEVLTGAEVSVEALLDLDQPELDALRIGRTGPLLVELPQREVAADPTWPVLDLLDAGVPVLIAHPERVPYLQGGPDALLALRKRGASTQLTSGALLGDFGKTARGVAIAMLRRGMIDVLASDAHHASLRPPQTSAALDWLRAARPSADPTPLAVDTPRMLLSRPDAKVTP